MGRKKKIKLEVLNPNAGGIDVGSRSHFVSIGQSLSDVKEFGVYDEDLKSLSAWLIENKVDTVGILNISSRTNSCSLIHFLNNFDPKNTPLCNSFT